VVEDEDEFNPMAGMGGGMMGGGMPNMMGGGMPNMMGGGMPNMMGGGMPGNGGDVDFEKVSLPSTLEAESHKLTLILPDARRHSQGQGKQPIRKWRRR
jgi:hypothetical protein